VGGVNSESSESHSGPEPNQTFRPNGNFKGELKVREAVRSADSIESFKEQQNTFLFRRAFDEPVCGRSGFLFITFSVVLSSFMTVLYVVYLYVLYDFSVCYIFVLVTHFVNLCL